MNTERRSTRPLIAPLVLACLLGAFPALAHQNWLAPNFFVSEAETAWLSFDHTFGDRRFHADSGPSAYYQWWIVGPDLKIESVPSLFIGKTKTVGEVELTEAGTYRIEAEEANMTWTKIKSDGEDTWQPGARGAFPGREIVESKVFFAKAVTYVTLGEASRSVLESTGDPLEIVFQDHPSRLRTTESFRLKMLSLGKPVAAQELRLFADQGVGHDPEVNCTTDTNGSCEFVVEHPGRYLLTARIQGSTSDDPQVDGFSYSVSVMIEVASKTES